MGWFNKMWSMGVTFRLSKIFIEYDWGLLQHGHGAAALPLDPGIDEGLPCVIGCKLPHE